MASENAFVRGLNVYKKIQKQDILLIFIPGIVRAAILLIL
jgi:hypothetical protein